MKVTLLFRVFNLVSFSLALTRGNRDLRFAFRLTLKGSNFGKVTFQLITLYFVGLALLSVKRDFAYSFGEAWRRKAFPKVRLQVFFLKLLIL